MKSSLVSFVVGVGLGAGAGWGFRGQAQGASQASTHVSAQHAAAPNPSATPIPAGKVVYTFKDETGVREFAQLWQQRQGGLLRQAMIQSYWNGEQANLAKINDQLKAEYGIDPAKRYMLKTDQRTLVEEAAPPAPGAENAKTPAAPQAEAAKESVVHTFADDEAMKAFANLWQQRQAVLMRLSTLQAYGNQEKATVAQLNEKLEADYHIDVTKDYTFDAKQRTLIGRETPPPAVAPAAGTAQASQPAGTEPAGAGGDGAAPPKAQEQSQSAQ